MTRLIDEPEATLRSIGIDVPPGLAIKVLEDTERTRHIVSRLDA